LWTSTSFYGSLKSERNLKQKIGQSQSMDSDKQQLIDKLKTATNILVTVSRNPSVDQLASCIGLTLLLNKQGKHAAAVFSGEVPSTLEFLDPGETIEKNTDSLRDFIIALDKSKADKLRYKVEDNIVRIFITPYKTSISQADLEFSEGDFNVDVVVALGVGQQEELDEAITAHGRILHDALVTSISTAPDSGLGTINWRDPQASSLSELVTQLAQELGPDLLDNQIATALLTGIVSETGRFSNDKTSSQAMSASAALMSAGANQQLVASKLEEGETLSPATQTDSNPQDVLQDQAAKPDDGTIRINHDDEADKPKGDENSPPKQSTDNPSIFIMPEDEKPTPAKNDMPSNLSEGAKLMTEPPSLGGTLTANSDEERLDPATDPLAAATPPVSLTPPAPPVPPANLTPPPAAWTPPPTPSLTSPPNQPPIADDDKQTLAEIEDSVGSDHIKTETVEEARQEVDEALSEAPSTAMPAEPIEALGSQPLGGDLHPPAASPPPSDGQPQVTDPTAPPPVPPPIPFQFGNPSPPAN
jgi:hypothetical protein